MFKNIITALMLMCATSGPAMADGFSPGDRLKVVERATGLQLHHRPPPPRPRPHPRQHPPRAAVAPIVVTVVVLATIVVVASATPHSHPHPHQGVH